MKLTGTVLMVVVSLTDYIAIGTYIISIRTV